ncbi:hypothetical protein BT96DRAFT_1019368 [Gymnopus androsaceus JB14]|uniref:Uncharacterized protein n=1 Tax=Gymnopus androsaceus JB14 TaxID=1447944 RepID=A0A6A4HNV6_9AGAR|nr:hypothetical protein BT96DRAFT_1019368 [Gymnopus androsaceus JB14]
MSSIHLFLLFSLHPMSSSETYRLVDSQSQPMTHRPSESFSWDDAFDPEPYGPPRPAPYPPRHYEPSQPYDPPQYIKPPQLGSAWESQSSVHLPLDQNSRTQMGRTPSPTPSEARQRNVDID